MNTINFERAARAIVSGVAGEKGAGEAFWEALQNREENSSWDDETRIQKGIAMCCAGSEGLPAIIRAFRQLIEPIEPGEFAVLIAERLQKFARHFPEDDDNICYAHFLLHGLVGANADQVADKIDDNARIIFETQKVQQLLIESLRPEQPVTDYTLKLRPGQYDAQGGISLWLEPGRGDQFLSFAQVGFFLDTTNSRGVIITVQGRRVLRESPFPDLLKKSREEGRDYARLAAILGRDPREFVLTQALSLLRSAGVKEVFAIRPEEHVMAIGRHPGFRGGYRSILEKAGMVPFDHVYYRTAWWPGAL